MLMKCAYIRCFINIDCRCTVQTASAQTAYYIDGYHGGIWGHYPDWNTRFMADMLKKQPCMENKH
jgi:hypothetical protein